MKKDEFENDKSEETNRLAIAIEREDFEPIDVERASEKRKQVKLKNNVDDEEKGQGDDEYQDSYRVRLDSFDGPLDLLLHLIKNAKIDIQDIFISEVTAQYIQYMDDIGQLEMEKASEFLSVAATLLEIKSKALLPRLDMVVDDENDNEKSLIQKLEEYAAFKELSGKLKNSDCVDRFYKSVDQDSFEPVEVLKDATVEGLMLAFSKMMSKIAKKENAQAVQREIKKDVFTVKQKMEFVKEIIVDKKKVKFSNLFNQDSIKVEVITTFQALLELLKLQIITVEQSDNFQDITIKLKDGAMALINTPFETDENKESE